MNFEPMYNALPGEVTMTSITVSNSFVFLLFREFGPPETVTDSIRACIG